MDDKYEGFDEDYDARKQRERSLSAKYIDKAGCQHLTDEYTIEEDVVYLIERLQKEVRKNRDLIKRLQERMKQSQKGDTDE